MGRKMVRNITIRERAKPVEVISMRELSGEPQSQVRDLCNFCPRAKKRDKRSTSKKRNNNAPARKGILSCADTASVTTLRLKKVVESEEITELLAGILLLKAGRCSATVRKRELTEAAERANPRQSNIRIAKLIRISIGTSLTFSADELRGRARNVAPKT